MSSSKEWLKVLTKKQILHLVEYYVECGELTLEGFVKLRRCQKARRSEVEPEACWTCRGIENRLKDKGLIKE